MTCPRLIVVFPGLGIDTTTIERFVEALDFQSEYHIVEYACVDVPLAKLRDFEASVQDIFDELRPRLSDLDFGVIGYSIGGVLGHIFAEKASHAGLNARWVAMLDSAAELSPPRTTKTDSVKKKAALRRLRLGMIEHALYRLAMRWRALKIAQHILRVHQRIHGIDASKTMRIDFLVTIWRRYVPTPRPVDFGERQVLFKARIARPRIPSEDLGWRKINPQLVIVPVEGNHWTMLDAPESKVNAGLVSKTLRAI